MPEFEAEKILTAIEEADRDMSPLYERMEQDYGLWRLEPYHIDPKKGDTDDYTSNSPRVFADSVINDLATARLKLTLTLDPDDSEATKKSLGITERMLFGFLNQINAQFEEQGEPDLQWQCSWYTGIRGPVIPRLLMLEDDDGNPIADLALWDALHTRFAFGKKGMAWVAARRYASEEDVEENYGITLKKEASKSGIEVWNCWKGPYEGVIIPQHGKVWAKEPEKKGNVDYLPATIISSGTAPLIHSTRYADTIKDWSPSLYAGSRDLYEQESKMMSYALTQSGLAVFTPTVIFHAGALPPEMESNPYKKSNVIFLPIDKVKPTDVKSFIEPKVPQDLWKTMELVMGQDSRATRAPVAYGEINQALPAQGIDILTHSAGKSLKMPKATVEKAIRWICNQIRIQYKEGDFKETELEGSDSTSKHFVVKVAPDKVNTKRQLEVKLVPDAPRNEQINATVAGTLKDKGLMPTRRILERFLDSQDPDADIEELDKEKMDQNADIKLRRALQQAVEERDYEAAAIFQSMINERDQQREAQMNGGQPPQQGGGQQPVPMAAQVAGMGARPVQVPPQVRQDMNESMRLKRMGMVAGR